MAPITDIAQLDPTQSYTYADYLGWRFKEYVELIKGKLLRKMAGPSAEHQYISANMHRVIGNFLWGKPCRSYAAPFDVRLLRSTGNRRTASANGDTQIRTVVQPDLCVICDLAKIDKRGCLGAPDWIIEIVSPSSLVLDTRTKFDLYAENGVREYWIVYPGEQTVTAFVLTEADEYEATGTYAEPGPMPSAVLPELAVEWADVFGEPR